MHPPMTPEAWLVSLGPPEDPAVLDEHVAALDALAPAGLRPHLVVLLGANAEIPADLPLDATVMPSAGFELLADSRAVTEALEVLADQRGRPAMMATPESGPVAEGFARVAVRWGATVLPRVRSWEVRSGIIDCACEGLAGQGDEWVHFIPGNTILVTLTATFAALGSPARDRPPGRVDVLAAPGIDRDVSGGRLLDEGRRIADMARARIVVAAGMGLGTRSALRLVSDLAEVLDAAVGATRPIVDLGWLPLDRLIGTTGRSIRPDLYVAVGISGAAQHVSGVHAGKVISVNIDPAATMNRLADLALVGNLHEVVPALTEAIRRRTS